MNRRQSRPFAPTAGVALLVVLGACLDRPVETSPPDEKTTFTTSVRNTAIDKLDLLFMIDNSASMGDKQNLLAAAIPDMITRLVTPNCVNGQGNVLGASDMNGNCAMGGTVEFPPVHDMHIGIVTSSIGSLYPINPPSQLGESECDPNALSPVDQTLNAHMDDRGELINRSGADEAPIPDADPDHFLAWFPPASVAPANATALPPPVPPETEVGAVGQPGTLIGDFAAMVAGVHEHGCGFEAQNEAWYRFLIQPDPYDHLEVGSGAAQFVESEGGTDAVILQQRAAFLRPDSLVAVIAVSDENEDHYDPLAFYGEGWLFEQSPFPGSSTGASPEGTVECSQPTQTSSPSTTGPFGPDCQSCAAENVVSDPNFSTRCPTDPPTGTDGYLDPSDDGINLRFFQPKRRFGVAPYYPVSRYVRGLTSPIVPDRAHEHDSSGNYIGDQDAHSNCVNPLFAQSLPTDPTQELCALQRGPRTPDLVYFAAITGVPHQLLQVDPTDPDSPQKDTLLETDWAAITGADPDHDDFTGADPHMLESSDPRATGCPPTSNDYCDPINGREYLTSGGTVAGKQDMEFACIFPFVDPTTGQPAPKNCALPQYADACDCVAGDIHQDTPLCAKDATGAYTTTQLNGKAYPALRELEVAHGMGAQGIVSSLCPIHPSPVGGLTDPLFGYRPAVNSIVNRLKIILQGQCLPEQLDVDPATGQVPCLLLDVMYPNAGASEEDTCDDAAQGLSVPDVDILDNFVETQHNLWVAAGGAMSGQPDPNDVPVCQLNQIKNTDAAYASCAGGVDGGSASAEPPGWCYVQGGNQCPQEVRFTRGEPLPGSVVMLQCLEQTNAPVDGGIGTTM
jgi:hypothetical protein